MWRHCQSQTCEALITPVMWVVAAGRGWGGQPRALKAGLVFPHQGQLLGLDVKEALVIWAAAVWGLSLLGVVPLGLCSPSPSIPCPLQEQLSGRRLVHNPDTGGRQAIQEPVVVQDKVPREKKVKSRRTLFKVLPESWRKMDVEQIWLGPLLSQLPVTLKDERAGQSEADI